jgi:DNA-binding MarR family transcriptional regulator
MLVEQFGEIIKVRRIELAKRTGITASRTDKLLSRFLEKHPLVETLVKRSFLSEANKRGYYLMYVTRLNSLLEK